MCYVHIPSICSFIVKFQLNSFYGHPVDTSCSYHVVEIYQILHFFCPESGMETIVVSTGWLVFISIFNYFVPTGNKDDNNNQ